MEEWNSEIMEILLSSNIPIYLKLFRYDSRVIVISTTLPTETVAQLQNVISTGGRNPMNSLDGRIEHGISPRKRGNYSIPPLPPLLHHSIIPFLHYSVIPMGFLFNSSYKNKDRTGTYSNKSTRLYSFQTP